MFRRLLLPLAVIGTFPVFTQCTTSDAEKLPPVSQRAFRLEQAEPLLLDTMAPGPVTASVAPTGAVAFPLSDTDYRTTHSAPDARPTSTPADVRALLVRAKAKSHLKNYDAALADLNMAVHFSPANAEAYYQRGLTRLKLKQFPAAIADFNKATQYNPQYKEAFFGRGAARIQTLNFKAAIPDFTAAIALDSTFADAYEYRGISYASLSKPTEARADLARAVQLNPAAEKSFQRYVEQ